VFLEAIKRWEGRYTAHNLKFDVGMIKSTMGYQMPQDRCDDTRLMSHVLEPTYSTALKPLAARLVDPMAGGLQDQLGKALNTGWTWATVPLDYEPYWTYAALDCVLTQRLEAVQRPRLIELGCLRAYELELAASWVCERMERRGTKIDRPFAQTAFTEFKKYSQALSDWCKENYGVRPGQTASVAQELIAQGVPLDRKTASGAVQLDKEVLGGIDHPLAVAVLEFRRYVKLANTYVKNFLALTTDDDPYLRPRINTVGARTGRMSMDTPNLQNLPRLSYSNPAAITVRNCLIASPENILLMVDYDQVELRFLAHLAGDEGLREAFRHTEEVDFFTAAGRGMFNEPEMDKKDHRRQMTKNAFYAKGYGAGAAKFAKTAGLSPEEGQAVYNAIDAVFPGVTQLGRMVESRALTRLREEGIGYAKSPLTGRRHPVDSDGTYKLVNYLVQGTSAELLKMKLIELDNAGFGPYMCLPVHDEVVFDVPLEYVREFANAACSIMSDSDLITVPLTVGASTGPRWGEKQDFDL
jgi:DNA polymerase-1